MTGAEKVHFELELYGDYVSVELPVETRNVGLADTVSWARAVSDKVTSEVVCAMRSDGARIACRKGCSACCSYLVPLSVPEAFRINADIDEMPDGSRERVQREFIRRARHIIASDIPWAGETDGLFDSARGSEYLEVISEWYEGLEIECPFLDAGVCSIYQQRPMACREFFVAGCSGVCSGGPGTAEKVRVPVRMSEVLGRLAAEFEGTNVEGLVMPLVTVWADQNRRRSQRTWPAAMLAERFVEITQEMLAPGPGAAFTLQTLSQS